MKSSLFVISAFFSIFASSFAQAAVECYGDDMHTGVVLCESQNGNTTLDGAFYGDAFYSVQIYRRYHDEYGYVGTQPVEIKVNGGGLFNFAQNSLNISGNDKNLNNSFSLDSVAGSAKVLCPKLSATFSAVLTSQLNLDKQPTKETMNCRFRFMD